MGRSTSQLHNEQPPKPPAPPGGPSTANKNRNHVATGNNRTHLAPGDSPGAICNVPCGTGFQPVKQVGRAPPAD